MTGGGYVDGIRQVFDPFMEGNLEEAENAYKRTAYKSREPAREFRNCKTTDERRSNNPS